MITTAKFDPNGELLTKYNQIFTDAWTALVDRNLLRGSKDKEAALNGQTAFADLQHYLSYIEQLVAIDPIYLMLPIDEEPFEIDANTRFINPPKEFNGKCCGVTSDNYAEILTFTVDRYFDYQDLSMTTIGIQWVNEQAKKEGISIIKLIDLKTLGSEHKIRFGWPLTKEMTEAPGNLRFAVRFFTRGETGDFDYLLSTAPQSISIKDTLAYHEGIKENATDDVFFKNFVKNSNNPSYVIPTRVNFLEAPDNSAAIIVNPGKADNDTLTLTAQAVTADLNPVIYKWYHENVGYRVYTPKDLETGEAKAWPSIRPAKPVLYVIDEKATQEDGEEIIYKEYTGQWPTDSVTWLYEKDPTDLIIGNENDPLYEISSEWHLYNPVDSNGNPAWPEEKDRPLFTLWVKVYENGIETDAYEPFRGDWPTEKPTGANALYFSKSSLFFKPTTDANRSIANTVVGKYYVRGINENRYDEEHDAYNRTYTDAPALGCEIAPPGIIEIDTSVEFETAKFLDSKTAANNIISVTIKPDEENKNPYRTYTVQKLTTTVTPDPDTQESITKTEWKAIKDPVVFGVDNKATYQVTEVGSYRFYLYSELNRDNVDTYSPTCEFFNPPIDLEGTMKIDDQVATANSFPYRYNANTKTIVVGEKYDSSTGEWIVDEEFDNLGDKYKLYILRDLAKEDPSSVGEVTYEWKYALLDEKSNSELITITPDKIQPNTSVLVGLESATYADYINPTTNKPFVSQAVFDEVYPKMHSKLGQKLEIQVRDNLQAYQFVCNIRNAIETNAGDQDTLSEAYTFCFK